MGLGRTQNVLICLPERLTATTIQRGTSVTWNKSQSIAAQHRVDNVDDLDDAAGNKLTRAVYAELLIPGQPVIWLTPSLPYDVKPANLGKDSDPAARHGSSLASLVGCDGRPVIAGCRIDYMLSAAAADVLLVNAPLLLQLLQPRLVCRCRRYFLLDVIRMMTRNYKKMIPVRIMSVPCIRPRIVYKCFQCQINHHKRKFYASG